MIVPISIHKFVKLTFKRNPGPDQNELTKALRDTLAAKNEGAVCIYCGVPIWAGGSALTRSDMCFTCITGEADDSKDYAFISNSFSLKPENKLIYSGCLKNISLFKR